MTPGVATAGVGREFAGAGSVGRGTQYVWPGPEKRFPVHAVQLTVPELAQAPVAVLRKMVTCGPTKPDRHE